MYNLHQRIAMAIMKISTWYLCFALAGACAVSQSAELDKQNPVHSFSATDCEISIVGGGPAGLYMAYQLGPIYHDKVCLFEKESRLGGRIYDISKNSQSEQGPLIAVGGRRVMEGQEVLFKLAKDLDLELEKPDLEAELIFARGLYSTNPDDFVVLYPGVEFDQTKGDAPTQLLQRLRES